jgi:hypothetical protein
LSRRANSSDACSRKIRQRTICSRQASFVHISEEFFALSKWKRRKSARMEVTSGVHLLQATRGSYAYLILGDEPVLIDTSLPGRLAAILLPATKAACSLPRPF